MLVTKALRTTKTLLLKNCTKYAKTTGNCMRFYGKKTDKPDHNPPPTCKSMADTGECASLKDVVCGKKIQRAKKKTGQEGFQFMHLLKMCCEDPCADASPRYDDCLYKESDKAKRKYQQTWVECPKIKIKPKEICCFEKGDYPPAPRRKPKKMKPQKKAGCDSGLSLCPKITLPGCRAVASETKCKREKRKAYCKKVKVPYPSYSECDRPKQRPRRKTECDCLRLPPTCIIYRVMNEMEKAGRTLKCP